MVYEVILFSVTLIGLLIGTITDLKTREVPDWLNYGLICIGLGLNLLFSIIYWNYWFFVNSVAGFVIFLIIALVMFYSGQWGGGDSKMLMGLGALIGFDVRLSNVPFIVGFFINILLVGAAYGLLWSLVLMVRNWKKFLKEFRKISKVKVKRYVLGFSLLMVVLFFFNIDNLFGYMFLALLFMAISTFFLWIFVKSIEKVCMVRYVSPDKLTEGDWIVKDVRYKGKYLCGPKDLGIEKKQIRELKRLFKLGKIKRVLIKEGIPFVPSFLIAYIISLIFGNVFFMFV